MRSMTNLGRVCGLLLLGGIGAAAMAAPAHAYWQGSVWIDVPGTYYYPPPPVYYAPPPVYVRPYVPPPRFYGQVWIPGHYNGWVWVPGHWA